MNSLLKQEYNTSYKCNYYNEYLNSITNNQLTREQNEEYLDLLYREDLLNIFNLKEDDDFEKINLMLDELYVIMKEHEEFKKCLLKCSNILLTDDELLGFRILYSYDFTHITHDCVCQYLETSTISNENICLLKSKIY